MSENNTNNHVVKIELPDCVDKTITNITDKPSKTLGKILADLLYLVLGNTSFKADKKRLEHEHGLKQFAKELEGDVNKIDPEKRIEPNTHKVCTALESMRYCVEEKELRKMFAKLIANSINSDKAEMVHPSYGEIIRQLTSFDAIVFEWLSRQEAIPTIRLRITDTKNDYTLQPDFYLETSFGNQNLLQVSLDNLSRLKLINLNIEKQYADTELYEKVLNNSELVDEKKKIAEDIEEDQSITYEYSSIEITSFGRHFYEACS